MAQPLREAARGRGRCGCGRGTLEASTVAEVDRQFAVNVRAPLFPTQALSPHLADRGGRVIVLSSVVARTDFAGLLPCAMTKGAVIVFIRNLAGEFGARGITVNGVAPGVIGTGMSDFVKSDAADARRVTGQVIEVPGGSKLWRGFSAKPRRSRQGSSPARPS